MLANRVRKNLRHLRKWARRDHVTCFRIYDRDIPEVPVAIDWYDGNLLVAGFDRRDEELEESWLEAMADAARTAAGSAEGDVFIKHRRRQRGQAQYERVARTEDRMVVGEGGHRFLVNLSDYLDTGLFLDHRALRRRVETEAAGRAFLNLFCYTGAFSVYAAAGGARTTTSLDMSRRYIDWCRDNLALNEHAGDAHQFVCDDAMVVLERGRLRDRGGARFDLAVLDPPTFSNSKKMRGVLDTRRDHGRLIAQTLGVMNPGGVLYFSTNSRKFQLDESGLSQATVEDITAAVAPPDFRRSPHRCWRIELPG